MFRRTVVCLLLSVFLLTIAEAQQTGKISRIGFLDNSSASGSAVLVEALRQEMGKLGWIEGRNITIEYRFADQKLDRLPELAEELVRLKVDLIVVTGTAAGLAAKGATSTIPIVMTTASDPVAVGVISSLSQPGGNVTGFFSLNVELNTKRLEVKVLKDAVPKLARVGLLRRPEVNIAEDLQLKGLRAAALTLKLKLEEMETQLDSGGLESAFQTSKRKKVSAIMTSRN